MDDLDAADLRADGGGARGDGDGGVGDRVVEVDLQPLPDRGLQRVGHPAGRRVAVDGRGGPVAGATLGSAVESAAELDAESRPPVQLAVAPGRVARRDSRAPG